MFAMYYYLFVSYCYILFLLLEKDPYFLDQSVFMAFHEREIIHLKALYHEELEHFGSITADRFMDILYEVGNSRVPIGKLHKIFEVCVLFYCLYIVLLTPPALWLQLLGVGVCWQ